MTFVLQRLSGALLIKYNLNLFKIKSNFVITSEMEGNGTMIRTVFCCFFREGEAMLGPEALKAGPREEGARLDGPAPAGPEVGV